MIIDILYMHVHENELEFGIALQLYHTHSMPEKPVSVKLNVPSSY